MIKIIITNQKPKRKKLLHKSSKAIHKYIISLLENKFLELGTGLLLLDTNTKFLQVAILIKELKHTDISQLQFYVNYVNKNIKKDNHNKTIALLIVKKKNTFIIEYTTSNDISITTYVQN